MNASAARVCYAPDHTSLQDQITAAIAAGYTVPGQSSSDVRGWLLTVMFREAGLVEYSADGAISPVAGIAVLNKSSAGAYTLAAPTAAQTGLELKIITDTAFAHVLTANNLLDDGVTGGAKDTATAAAFVGCGLHLIAHDGTWKVLAKNLFTIAAV